MREISPISIWKNGQQIQANNIKMYIVHDNLASSATFYYELLNVDAQTSQRISLSDGNLIIDGQDYIDWGENEDINQAAFTWVAGQLNITLV